MGQISELNKAVEFMTAASFKSLIVSLMFAITPRMPDWFALLFSR